MKLKFVTGDEQREEVKEVRLSIRIAAHGAAYVTCGGYILAEFVTDGTLRRMRRVPDTLGFKLDAEGRIQLSGEGA